MLLHYLHLLVASVDLIPLCPLLCVHKTVCTARGCMTTEVGQGEGFEGLGQMGGEVVVW
jgi:hypothetical protein